MTARDDIIYWSITAFMFVGIIACFIWYHTKVQVPLDGERQSMIQMLAPYAAIVSAISALISAVAVLISTRKTRRERIDELKVEMLVILSHGGTYTIIDGTEDEEFQQLDFKYKDPKYAILHRYAFDELKSEGKIKVIPDPSKPGPEAYR